MTPQQYHECVVRTNYIHTGQVHTGSKQARFEHSLKEIQWDFQAKLEARLHGMKCHLHRVRGKARTAIKKR